MTASDTTTQTRKCLGGCGRTLRSAEAVSRGYGSGCWRKIRRAARAADLSAWTGSQAADARQALEDGAVVPSTREGVYHVVSSDGSEVYRTHANGCSCTNGLQTRPSRPCWHRAAVAIVTAVPAPAVPARAPIALPPVPRDLVAELIAMQAYEFANA